MTVFILRFLKFLKIFPQFVASLEEICDLFLEIITIYPTHCEFVLVLWEFYVNFKDFSEFFEVLWIFLDFMTCSSLVLDFDAPFFVFSVLLRLIWILYEDCLIVKFFKDFSSVFCEFIRYSWFISRNYYNLFESLWICFDFLRVLCQF